MALSWRNAHFERLVIMFEGHYLTLRHDPASSLQPFSDLTATAEASLDTLGRRTARLKG